MGVSPKTYTLLGASIFFFVFWTGFWFVHLMAIFHGRFKFHRKPVSLVRETPLPGVSIIKPLLGVDQNLFGNLETFFTLDYPFYELLFCIKDESDPVIMLVNSLIEKYPHIDAKVFIGGEKVGVNPKINNMQPGYKAAKYELVMISDSGIRMKEDTLLDMVDHMTDRVGLVHQMPFVCDREGFPSVLEKVYFGTAHARIYLAADLVRSNCCTGMSTLMRKSILEAEGGIQAFGCYLAEDYFFAKAVLNQGYRLRVSSQPAWQNSGVCDIDQFKARTTRWAQLRIAMIPILMVVEPLSECLVLGLNAAWATSYLFNWDPIAFYLTHVLIWFLLDWTLLCIVQVCTPDNSLSALCTKFHLYYLKFTSTFHAVFTLSGSLICEIVAYAICRYSALVKDKNVLVLLLASLNCLDKCKNYDLISLVAFCVFQGNPICYYPSHENDHNSKIICP